MDLKALIEANWDLTWDAEPTVGTDKTGKLGHSFIDNFYNEEFKKYQNKQIELLEIGVYRGASLALWSKYFTKGHITGLDIQDIVVPKYQNIERVDIGICDAYNLEIVKQLGNFDIIIDDGPHTIPTLQQCIELYLPKLNEGGIMILEDVQDPSWFPLLTEKVPEGFKYECIDLREHLQRYDDLLFIIRN